VNRVKAVGIREKRIPSCAPYPRNHNDLVMGEPEPLNGIVQTLVNPEISATRTPGRQARRSDGEHFRFTDFIYLFGKKFTGCFHSSPLQQFMINS
jgi:hypothetical protein